VGMLGALAIPLLTVLLAITVVGLVALPVVAVGVAMAAVLGMPALSVAIGRRVPGRLTPVGQLAAGTATVVLATQLPGVGGPLFAVALLVGLGAVLATRFGGQAGRGAAPDLGDPTR